MAPASTPSETLAPLRAQSVDSSPDCDAGQAREAVPWFHTPATARDCVEGVVNGIFYRVHGDAEAAATRCVFVQGVAASLDNNRYVLRALGERKDLCVVCLDNVGVGGSVAPPSQSEYSIARMAQDVAAVADAVGWTKMHLVGHSMGGMICLEFDDRWPERVLSLALLSTTPRRRALDAVPNVTALPDAVRLVSASTREQRVRADHGFHFTSTYLDGAFSEDELRFFSAPPGRRREFWVAEYLGSDSQKASDAMPKHALNNQLAAAMGWRLSKEGLDKLRDLPVLIVHGDADLVVRPSSARHLYRTLTGPSRGGCCGCCLSDATAPRGPTNARLLVIPGGAHMITSSHPRRVAEAVEELWGSSSATK